MVFQGHEGASVPRLHFLLGKEDGHVYYAANPLQSSPTAVWILNAADTMQEAYSRLPLLVTPTASVPPPPGFAATLTGDVGGNAKGDTPKTDGQSEISVVTAKEHGTKTVCVCV